MSIQDGCYDIPKTGYHKCAEMPQNEFIERQQNFWHIHKTDIPHSKYRKDLRDGICPYCNENLNDVTNADLFVSAFCQVIKKDIDEAWNAANEMSQEDEELKEWFKMPCETEEGETK